MPINWHEYVWDQDLWKLIRANSQLECARVTSQNLSCTVRSVTVRGARSVCVSQGVSCCNAGALGSSTHQVLHGVHELFKEQMSCLSVTSGNTESSRAFGAEFHRHVRAAVEEQLVGRAVEAAERTVPAALLGINYTYWTSACSFKPSVGDQAWHYFNSSNCDSDACLETALTGKSTEHVSFFSRL